MGTEMNSYITDVNAGQNALAGRYDLYFSRNGELFRDLVRDLVQDPRYGLDPYDRKDLLVVAVLIVKKNKGKDLSSRLPEGLCLALPSLREIEALKSSPASFRMLLGNYAEQLQRLGVGPVSSR